MTSLAQIGRRLETLTEAPGTLRHKDELLRLGEETLEHWVLARGEEPTQDEREGFRLLALHRQGATNEPSFNACRETCRELVYHYNLLTMQPSHEDREQRALMLTLLVNHLFLFVSGKMEVEGLGDFCCSARPLRTGADDITTTRES